jgi:hypothetical protein
MGWEEYEQTRIREIKASHLPPRPLGVLKVQDYSIQQLYILHQKVFVKGKPTSPRFPAQIGVLGVALEMMGFWMVEW